MLDVDNYENKKINPWVYETISVYKWSFIGWVKKIMQEMGNSDDWLIAKAEQGFDSQFDFEWHDENDYYLKRLDFSALKKNNCEIVFVNNKYFDYSDAGLIVANNKNGQISPQREMSEQENKHISYEKDTLYQHNKALLNCYETEFKPKLKYAFWGLSKYWGANMDWDKLIKIMICFHDYGKLNGAWQSIMLEYQRKKMNDDQYFEILAHTDYDQLLDEILAKACKIKSKPSHAGIGAMQVYEMLFDEYGEEIGRTVGCAILKHHSVDSKSFESFSISDEHLSDMKKLLDELKFAGTLIQKGCGEDLTDIIPNKVKDKEWLLYLFFARILRLCDQKATESFEKYNMI